MPRQVSCCAGAARRAHLLSQNKHVWVARHLLVHRRVQRISHRQLEPVSYVSCSAIASRSLMPACDTRSPLHLACNCRSGVPAALHSCAPSASRGSAAAPKRGAQSAEMGRCEADQSRGKWETRTAACRSPAAPRCRRLCILGRSLTTGGVLNPTTLPHCETTGGMGPGNNRK